jgi:hypothetical protein
MIPGIDPKIDIAFKKVFGSERSGDLTAALINAVRAPPPEHRVIEVEFLNPYSDRMSLDDKLSILDVKARDQAVWKMLAQSDLCGASSEPVPFFHSPLPRNPDSGKTHSRFNPPGTAMNGPRSSRV